MAKAPKRKDNRNLKAEGLEKFLMPNRLTIFQIVFPLFRGIAESIRLAPYGTAELEVNLANKIMFAEDARKRSKSPLSRLWSRIFGKHPDKIEVDGIVLQQLFEILKKRPPGQVDIRRRYLLPTDIVIRLYDAAFKGRQR